MMKTKPYTTEDADRLLGLADQFLDDWAEDAVQGGESDEEYEQRVDEWAVYRPLFLAAPALLKALQAAENAVTYDSEELANAGQSALPHDVLVKIRAAIAKTRGGAA